MTDPIRAAGPEEPLWRKLIGFGKLSGLQDIYEGDEVRIQGGVDQAGSSSSVEVTEKNWQDQVDGVSDKWKDDVRIVMKRVAGQGSHSYTVVQKVLGCLGWP